MRDFDDFVYFILDKIIFNDTGLFVFFLGGYVLCIVCVILLSTPLGRKTPLRPYLIVSSIIPVIVWLYGGFFNLFIAGRDLRILLALSPSLISTIPSVIALIKSLKKGQDKNLRSIVMISCILVAQLWANLTSWLMTDYGFMGASC